nr:MAG TPA: hypothetical protein [Caudoviricetes sp.]
MEYIIDSYKVSCLYPSTPPPLWKWCRGVLVITY